VWNPLLITCVKQKVFVSDESGVKGTGVVYCDIPHNVTTGKEEATAVDVDGRIILK
jgi:hypothetical protein